jgi:hypothetical protein
MARAILRVYSPPRRRFSGRFHASRVEAALDTHREIVLGLNGQYVVDMKWTGPQDLFLSCSQCSLKNVNFEAVRAGDTTITYDKNLDVRAISPEAQ